MEIKIDIKDYYTREIDKSLDKWSKQDDKTIALITGVRRIGKTHALRFLGQTQFKRYAEIDVNDLTDEMVKKFSDKDTLVDSFKEYLLVHSNISVSDINSDLLVVFDEIQEHSELKDSVSFLNKNLDCRFACTGSALWIDDTNGKRPTAEFEKFTIKPFSFFEFLKIVKQDSLLKEEIEQIESKSIKPSFSNKKLNELLRIYIVVGGMPQPIRQYVDNKNKDNVFELVHRTQRVSLITTYTSDLDRYTAQLNIDLKQTYFNLVGNIGKINENALMPYYEKLIAMNLIIPVNSVSNLQSKMKLTENLEVAKFFMLDVGVLFYLLCGVEDDKVADSYYQNFVNGNDNDNNGYLFENFVASTIWQFNIRPFFKEFQEENEITHEHKSYELDFVYSDGKRVVVLEAKSGSDKEHKSLTLALKKYDKIKISYILSKSYNFNKKNVLKGPHTIPFYMLPYFLEDK